MEPLGIPDRTAAMLTRCLFSQLALLSPKSGAETMLPPAMSHRSGDALIARPPRWANQTSRPLVPPNRDLVGRCVILDTVPIFLSLMKDAIILASSLAKSLGYFSACLVFHAWPVLPHNWACGAPVKLQRPPEAWHRARKLTRRKVESKPVLFRQGVPYEHWSTILTPSLFTKRRIDGKSHKRREAGFSNTAGR